MKSRSDAGPLQREMRAAAESSPRLQQRRAERTEAPRARNRTPTLYCTPVQRTIFMKAHPHCARARPR